MVKLLCILGRKYIWLQEIVPCNHISKNACILPEIQTEPQNFSKFPVNFILGCIHMKTPHYPFHSFFGLNWLHYLTRPTSEGSHSKSSHAVCRIYISSKEQKGYFLVIAMRGRHLPRKSTKSTVSRTNRPSYFLGLRTKGHHKKVKIHFGMLIITLNTMKNSCGINYIILFRCRFLRKCIRVSFTKKNCADMEPKNCDSF